MTRIGGGPPDKTVKPGEADPTQEGAGKAREAGGKDPKKVVDSFERAAPQITSRLEAMAAGKKAVAPTIHFTSEHLAEVAQAFAGFLRKNPGADRRTRAHMFAKAILRSRKFGRVFDEADEEELEDLYDQIADQLEGSPVLAQLVDEVTEGARKIM